MTGPDVTRVWGEKGDFGSRIVCNVVLSFYRVLSQHRSCSLSSTMPMLTWKASSVRAPVRQGAAWPPALGPFFSKTLQAVIEMEFRVKQQLLNWDMCEFTFCLIVMYIS